MSDDNGSWFDWNEEGYPEPGYYDVKRTRIHNPSNIIPLHSGHPYAA